MNCFHNLAQFWNHLFHEPIPVSTIAVFRIIFGILLTINSGLLLVECREFLRPDAVLSLERVKQIKNRLTLLALLPATAGSMQLLFGLHSIACLMLTLGFMTRLSAALVLVTLVSFYHRNPCIFHSGDAVIRIMTFLLIFSPAGQAYSVDASLAGTTDVPVASPWCQRLMQIQIAIVYLRTVFWKLRGTTWRDGTAAYYATQIHSYQRLSLPSYLQNSFFVRLATWSTLVIETLLGSTLWIVDVRYPVLLAGVLMHLTFELWLNVQLFGWTMMVCFLLFVDPGDMSRILG